VQEAGEAAVQARIPESAQSRRLEWVLRIALFGEFAGHGVFALMAVPHFVALLTGSTGMSAELAVPLLRVIGAVDLVIAAMALVRPTRIVLAYAAFWGLLTALSRPLSGRSVVDFVERWPNWGVPLALLLARGLPKSRREWLS
jgi:hypothetical protein